MENQDEDDLSLSLSLPTRPRLPTPTPPPPSPQHQHQLFQLSPPPPSAQHQQPLFQPLPPPPSLQHQHPLLQVQPPPPPPLVPQETRTLRTGRARKSTHSSPGRGKSSTVPQLYPWATDRRATIRNLDYLLSNGIHTISGELQCKRCERKSTIEFDLNEKFREIATYIVANKGTMHDRAPKCWTNPDFLDCNGCGEKALKPVVAGKKREINWLFLLLGKFLGFCTLEQLKYFCKHTDNHRTGAKDRVLYLTYLGLCKQLEPKGPFDR